MPVLSLKYALPLLALFLAGCYEPREVPASAAPACAEGCHGSAASAAPPPGLWLHGDKTNISYRGVGSHQAHLRSGGSLADPLTCQDCHKVPATIQDPGHMDSPLPAEVTWGSRAKAQGAKPFWDSASLTCKATYCHALDGGGVPAPTWNKPVKMVCGSCHGIPPKKTRAGKAHIATAITNCFACHPEVVDKAGAIIDKAKHVNGRADIN